jgi:hypothetical protein
MKGQKYIFDGLSDMIPIIRKNDSNNFKGISVKYFLNDMDFDFV